MDSRPPSAERLLEAQERLARVAGRLATSPAVKEKLEDLKNGRIETDKPDFLWEALLGSFSTMGNSRGHAGLMLHPERHDSVRFDPLSRLSPTERKTVLQEALRAAKVRMPDKKAAWLSQNFDKIQAMGGLQRAKQALLNAQGRKGKIEFLKLFEGIGPKYSRNIMMDVYDEDFHESIAVDERIKGITRELGLRFSNYEEEEQFYLGVAHAAKLNGWELDRLIYNFKEKILGELRHS